MGERDIVDGSFLEPQFSCLVDVLVGSLPCEVSGCPGDTMSLFHLSLSAG